MGKRILVIDDDNEFLEELQELLILSGYEVTAVNDSIAALDIAKLSIPDLILVDIKMNGLNGFQVADRLNQFGETAGVPVIAMSGYFKEDEHLALMQQLGIKALIRKPFSPLDVIWRIENFIKENKG